MKELVETVDRGIYEAGLEAGPEAGPGLHAVALNTVRRFYNATN